MKLSKSMADDQDTTEDTGSSDLPGPEYSFEGFDVDFSVKVMLTPAGPKTPAKGSA
jgi:hypothetical protein